MKTIICFAQTNQTTRQLLKPFYLQQTVELWEHFADDWQFISRAGLLPWHVALEAMLLLSSQ